MPTEKFRDKFIQALVPGSKTRLLFSLDESRDHNNVDWRWHRRQTLTRGLIGTVLETGLSLILSQSHEQGIFFATLVMGLIALANFYDTAVASVAMGNRLHILNKSANK